MYDITYKHMSKVAPNFVSYELIMIIINTCVWHKIDEDPLIHRDPKGAVLKPSKGNCKIAVFISFQFCTEGTLYGIMKLR